MAAETWDITTASSAGITLSPSGMAILNDTGTARGIRSTAGKTTGKWYVEVETLHTIDYIGRVGFMDDNATAPSSLGASGNSVGWEPDGDGFNSTCPAVESQSSGDVDTGGVLCFALDADTGEVWVRKKDSWSWFGSGDPVAGTDPSATLSCVSGAIHLAASMSIEDSRFKIRSLGRDLIYPPPTGFSPWGGGEFIADYDPTDGFIQVFPVTPDDRSVKTNTNPSVSLEAWHLFTGYGFQKDGTSSYTEWSGGASSTDYRINVDLGEEQTLKRLIINNHHSSGSASGTNSGLSGLKVYGTNVQTAFDETDPTILTDLTLLDTLAIDQHIDLDVAEDQIFDLATTGSFQYYIFVETGGLGGLSKYLRSVEMLVAPTGGDSVPVNPVGADATNVYATSENAGGPAYMAGRQFSRIPWLSDAASTNQKWCVALDSAEICTRLLLQNGWLSTTERSIKDFEIYGSNSSDAVTNIGDYSDLTGLTLLSGGLTATEFDIDTMPHEEFDFVNETAYQYYLLRIADNHGDSYMAIRDAVFMTEYVPDEIEVTVQADFALGATIQLGEVELINIQAGFSLGAECSLRKVYDISAINAGFALSSDVSMFTRANDISCAFVLGSTVECSSILQQDYSVGFVLGAVVEVIGASSAIKIKSKFVLGVTSELGTVAENNITASFVLGGGITLARQANISATVSFILSSNILIETGDADCTLTGHSSQRWT